MNRKAKEQSTGQVFANTNDGELDADDVKYSDY